MNKRNVSVFWAPWVFALLAMLTLGTMNVFGQANSGDVTGTVMDASGGAISSATVTAENEATTTKVTSITGSDGVYRFRSLPVGNYTITATAGGFGPGTISSLRVQLNQTITANLTLQVGSSTTTVEVTGAPPPIDTTTAQLQTTFEAEQLQNLPAAGLSRTIGGSSIFNVSLLGAGVSSQGGVGQGTGPSIAGQRPENNSFYLDGVGNNNHFSTGPLVVVSNEAVAEVSLLQNQFSAEYGGASGGVFNAVVKTGGNQIHGSAYEYFQNRNLNAVDATEWVQGLTSKPRFDQNRMGGTIGGPVVKNRFFYFGNFEYIPLGQSAVPGAPLSAPTAAGISLLNGISTVSKTNLAQFTKYVPVAATSNGTTAVVGGVNIPLGDLSFASPSFNNTYNAITSLDYNMTDRDQIRGRWVYNRSRGVDNIPNLPVFFGTQPNDNYYLSVSEFHTFSPTLQNEFRSSYSRNNQSTQIGNFTYPGLDTFPNLTIDELNLQIGPDGPGGYIQNSFQLQDNLSKVLGKHTIKVGGHFTDIILANFFVQRVRGDYEYSDLNQFLRDLTPDVLGERSAGPTSDPSGFLQHEYFANDDYRFRPNLTFNLGLRYEYVTIPVASRYQSASAPASVPGGITFAEPKPNKNEWSPRLGFAWSPGKNGEWSVRGGVARSFDLSYANLTANAAPPYYQTTQDVDLNSNAPNFLANGGLKGGGGALPTDPRAARAVVASYIFGGKRPYGLTWTLGAQRVVAKNYTVEVRYVGTKGVHLWNQTRLNVGSLVDQSNYIPTFFSLPSPATLAALPTYRTISSRILPGATAARPYDFLSSLGFAGNIVGYAPQGYSSYNGLAIQVNRRYSNNFQYLAAFTWSHLLDDSTATNFSTYLTPRRSQDFQNLRADWSSSALDHRYRFTFTPLYDWKPFKNGNWVLKNVAGNWRVSGTYTLEAPEFATVQSNVDSNLNGDSAGDRAIINPAGNANLGTGVTAYNAAGQVVAAGNAAAVAYVANNPNARYVVAQVGALANGGRNTFPLKRTNNIDLALNKQFTITEQRRVEIGASAFNVFNHAQYTGGYLSDVSSNGFVGSRNDLVPNNANFGRFDQYYSSNSRQMALTLRVIF